MNRIVFALFVLVGLSGCSATVPTVDELNGLLQPDQRRQLQAVRKHHSDAEIASWRGDRLLREMKSCSQATISLHWLRDADATATPFAVRVSAGVEHLTVLATNMDDFRFQLSAVVERLQRRYLIQDARIDTTPYPGEGVLRWVEAMLEEHGVTTCRVDEIPRDES